MPAFSLLTVNTFGVPLYLGWRRMTHLAGELSRLAPTVICLQEVQQNGYVPLLRRRLPEYPYLAFQSNWRSPKGGLLVASRASLARNEFFLFPNRGRWLSIGFSDWALFKGVLVAQLEVYGQKVIVLNTHLHANYLGDWRAENFLARIQRDQVKFLAELAAAQAEDAWVIVCGDFNFPRKSFLYEELIAQSGFNDPLVNDPRPTYRPLPFLANKWAIPLDFILYRAPKTTDFSVSADIIPIESSTARSSFSRFLTDHCALTLDVTWRN